MNKFGFPCYTYLIGWRDLDKWYYGYRSANEMAPEDDLMKRYFTSSRVVKSYIDQYGLPDVIKVHKLFETREAAIDYEFRFLTKVGATSNDRWLNQSIRGKKFRLERLSEEHKAKISRAQMGNRNGEGKRSEEFCRKIAIVNRRKAKCPKIRAKLRQAWVRRKARGEILGGWKWSESSKEKNRKPKKKLECPYCGKVGGEPAMKRWHFENCKEIAHA